MQAVRGALRAAAGARDPARALRAVPSAPHRVRRLQGAQGGGNRLSHEQHTLPGLTVYPSDSYLNVFVNSGDIPSCNGCGGILKPNVILIGEQLPVRILNEAKKQTRQCDLMLVDGSSLEMAPAGDLPRLAVETGARLVIVNFEPTHVDRLADATIYGDVVDVLPRLASALTQS